MHRVEKRDRMLSLLVGLDMRLFELDLMQPIQPWLTATTPQSQQPILLDGATRGFTPAFDSFPTGRATGGRATPWRRPVFALT
jgi:hypothetical protein